MDETFQLVKEDFLENGISSICYLMRKFKITSKEAHAFIKKLSRIADKKQYDKSGKIINVSLENE